MKCNLKKFEDRLFYKKIEIYYQNSIKNLNCFASDKTFPKEKRLKNFRTITNLLNEKGLYVMMDDLLAENEKILQNILKYRKHLIITLGI